MEALISMKDGAFGYTPETTTFRDIDFSIRPGEVLCILGPNGCGKTTLLDTLLGYHRLRSGEIRIDGRNADKLSARERAMKVAYVPQNHEKSFPYTVKQVIQMGRAPHLPFHSGPGSEDRHKVDEIIDRMKLSSLRNKEYTRLSGGETQLVLIARALVLKPELLILDEATSALDPDSEIEICQTLGKLSDKLTILAISHQTALLDAADRAYRLEGGIAQIIKDQNVQVNHT